MSFVDNAISLALFLLIFSSALTLLNSPIIGLGSDLGYKQQLDVGVSQEDLEKQIKKDRNFSPIPGLDYLYQMITAGIGILQTILQIPFAIYNASTLIIPGEAGAVIGTLFQIPADMIMAAGLALYFKR